MAPARTKQWLPVLLAAAGLGALVLSQRPSSQASPPPAASAKPAGSAKAASAKPKRRVKAAPGAPTLQRASASPKPREVLVRAAWGSAPGELGRSRPREGAPEAPMGLSIDARGRMHVLDQVNSRIQIFEPGKPPRVLPLPADTYQDIEALPSGGTAALDRLGTKTIAFYDASGELKHTVPIASAGVFDGGEVTGMFARPDGVWIEVEHSAFRRVTLADGTPDPEHLAIGGRLTPDGRSAVIAALQRPFNAVVRADSIESGGAIFETTVTFPIPIFMLHALEFDGAGRIYLAANLVREDEAPPYAVLEDREVVVVLAPNGSEIGRVEIAPPQGPDEQFRPIRVGEDGSIYQLVAGEEAATIEKYSL